MASFRELLIRRPRRDQATPIGWQAHPVDPMVTAVVRLVRGEHVETYTVQAKLARDVRDEIIGLALDRDASAVQLVSWLNTEPDDLGFPL